MVVTNWQQLEDLVARLMREEGVHTVEVDLRCDGNPDNPNIRVSNIIMRTEF